MRGGPDIVGEEQGIMRDIELGPATTKVAEDCGIVEPLREEDKAYIFRQKRPAETSHGMNKRRKLNAWGEPLAEELCHGECREWISIVGSSQDQSNFSLGATNFPARALAGATTVYMREEDECGKDIMMEDVVGYTESIGCA